VNLGKLSRFQSKTEQLDTVKKLAEGRLDVVVGTHRLLSPDVRFKDLGLLVIDEEQRFGVTHKEKIKKARTQVDVLTLTATPIPRTLHLAMANLRDLSIIATPPAVPPRSRPGPTPAAARGARTPPTRTTTGRSAGSRRATTTARSRSGPRTCTGSCRARGSASATAG
jgi:hypothetical protein